MNAEEFGLLQSDVEEILAVLHEFPEIDSAYIFGSRAKGNFRNGSDVDIALKGDISRDIQLTVSYLLNEYTMMPYRFDIAVYHDINNEDLTAHIDRIGRLIYSRDTALLVREENYKYRGNL